MLADEYIVREGGIVTEVRQEPRALVRSWRMKRCKKIHARARLERPEEVARSDRVQATRRSVEAATRQLVRGARSRRVVCGPVRPLRKVVCRAPCWAEIRPCLSKSLKRERRNALRAAKRIVWRGGVTGKALRVSIVVRAVALAHPGVVAHVRADRAAEVAADGQRSDRLTEMPHQRVADDIQATNSLQQVAHASARVPLEATAGYDKRRPDVRACRLKKLAV